MSEFVHLHVHSHYSVLDGMSKIPDLINKSIKCGMNSIALTDHGNMYGIKEFADCVNKVNDDRLRKPKEVLRSETATEEEKERAKAELEEIKKNLFKPIFGVEAYCARRNLYDKDKNYKKINPESGREQVFDLGGWHLILLAKNKTGYKNLCKLVSISWIDGFYNRPRIDKNILAKYHEGIIVCSACLGGELPQLIIAGKIDEAEKSINWFKSIFGDDYYIEIQRHKTNKPNADYSVYKRQSEVIPHLVELAKKTNTKVIATNDVHFVEEQHSEAHERLICLSTGKDLDDPTRMRYTKQEWLKTPEEMAEVFSDMPEVLTNTLEIEGKVEAYSIESGPIMPMFDIPTNFGTEAEYHQKFSDEDLFNEFTRNEKGEVVLSQKDAEDKVKKLGGIEKLYRIKLEADYLAKLAWEGARMRYGDPLTEEQHERIIFELHIMKTMGFPGYFLIVQDYIRAAREELGVSVGPGRGSAAGSVVAYCLKITDIDPLKYDLLFERFLNPDRISLPDIDVDFDDDGRADVLRWVTEKYGKERVAHIITYGTMATKSSIKDVARVQKVPLPMVSQLTGLIPDKFPKDSKTGKAPKVNLKNCLNLVPELKEALNGPDQNVSSMLTYAEELEDTIRQIGIHACGVIIGADNLTNFAPLATVKDKDSKEDVLVTQYDGHVVESVGLIKMDFLGLKTLSIIKDAIDNIKESTGKVIDIDHIPIDDPKTYDLYCKGLTIGTFQFESPGMQKYLRALQPSHFEDLIAMNALYRPGPMDYIPQFINRKLGREKVEYDIPCMKEYLEETYGITVYQEQVMLLSRQLANFTRGESDALRKAMGKKKRDVLDKMKSQFIDGGKKNGHDPKILEKIWGDWEKFAEYAFNKSHATCYSWVAYQTAWLKAHYTSEYMAAVLSRSINDITEVTKLLVECKGLGINVLGPDVNHSMYKFAVMENGDIRFGLGAIRGMGESAALNIIETRKQASFSDIFDFFERINLQTVNRKSLEVLVLAGAFDNIYAGGRRSLIEPDLKGVTFLDTLMRYGVKLQTEQNNSQMSLFGSAQGVELPKLEIPKIQEWPVLEKLKKEKEVIGIFLSAHPLDEYRFEIQNICNAELESLKELSAYEGKKVVIAGMVVEGKEGLAKNNKNYGRITLEDYSGKYDVMLFGKDFGNFRNYICTGFSLIVDGEVRHKTYGNTDELEFKVANIGMLSEAHERIKSIRVEIPFDSIDTITIDELERLVKAEKGNVLFRVKLFDKEYNISVEMFSKSTRINVSRTLLKYLYENDWEYKAVCK